MSVVSSVDTVRVETGNNFKNEIISNDLSLRVFPI